MIRCMAIDDEPLALSVIENYIGRCDDLELSYKSTDAIAAAGLLERAAIDLLFLDIQMPDISGLDLLKSLEHPPLVVFTTAYANYAVKGFDLDAADYLLKPFSFERFCKAVKKVSEMLRLRNVPAIKEDEGESIIVKSGYKKIKVLLSEIRYLEGYGDYVRIHTGVSKLMTLQSMQSILDKLPADRFIRIHRSYIISTGHLKAVSGKSVFIESVELPIGKKYKAAFQHRMEHSQWVGH